MDTNDNTFIFTLIIALICVQMQEEEEKNMEEKKSNKNRVVTAVFHRRFKHSP